MSSNLLVMMNESMNEIIYEMNHIKIVFINSGYVIILLLLC